MKTFFGYLIERETSTVALFRKANDGYQVLVGYKDDEGIWVLPGGGKNQGENDKQTAKRETDEETGMKVNKLHYLGAKDKHHFFASLTNTSKTPHGNDDLDKAKWVSINKLPQMAYDHDKWIQKGLERIK